jgi:hypothetical protein
MASERTLPAEERPQCQHRSQCINDATWGVYAWKPGETTVNLKTPVRVYCNQHKPKHHGPGSYRRNVRLP